MLLQDLLPTMTRIPAGSFQMGDDDGPPDERPAHRVHLDDYQVSVSAVTNAQYARFVREAQYRVPATYELPLVVTHGGPDAERRFCQLSESYSWRGGEPPPDRLDHPVTLVRWDDAVAYCEWLAGRCGLPVRLPTEAEWEKASRGGIDGKLYPWGDYIDASCANYMPDPSQRSKRATQPVGSYPPNAFGLRDMAGNVWSWVTDWYDSRYYASSPLQNPRGPASGRFRIVQGGAWLESDVQHLRCSYRHQVPADTYSYSIGFRIAY